MKTLSIRECGLLQRPSHDVMFLLKGQLDHQLEQLDPQAVS